MQMICKSISSLLFEYFYSYASKWRILKITFFSKLRYHLSWLRTAQLLLVACIWYFSYWLPSPSNDTHPYFDFSIFSRQYVVHDAITVQDITLRQPLCFWPPTLCLLALCCWASHLILLSFSFCICKIGITGTTLPEFMIKWDKSLVNYKVLDKYSNYY